MFLLTFLLMLGTGLQAQSMQFKEIFQPHLSGQFRGLNLGMTYTEANNVGGINRDQVFDNPNIMFNFPLSQYGMEGDKMEGYYIFSRDETLQQIGVNITMVDPVNLSDMEEEIREYFDYEYGSASNWGNESRWQVGATRITMVVENQGAGGLILIKYMLNRD